MNPNLQIKVKDAILSEYIVWKVLFVMQLKKIALKANGLKALRLSLINEAIDMTFHQHDIIKYFSIAGKL